MWQHGLRGDGATEPQTQSPHYSPPGPPRCAAEDCEGGESLKQTLFCGRLSPIESPLKGSLLHSWVPALVRPAAFICLYCCITA